MDIEYDDFDESCRLCGDTKENSPKLCIKFTTCCGYNICTACKDTLLLSREAKCPGCAKVLDKKEFSNINMDGQYVLKETLVRKDKIDKRVPLTQSDFDSVAQYNEYLEYVTDVVYDMTYGTVEQAQGAEDRLSNYIRTHKEKVDACLNRKKLAGHAMGTVEHAGIREAAASDTVRYELMMPLPKIEGDSHVVLGSDEERRRTEHSRRERDRLEHMEAIASNTLPAYFEARRLKQNALKWTGGYKTSFTLTRMAEEATADLHFQVASKFDDECGVMPD